jgi:hypothetical protein
MDVVPDIDITDNTGISTMSQNELRSMANGLNDNWYYDYSPRR